MRVRKPDELVLAYCRRMMAWLLLLEAPERLLQLGLGAGALTRFALSRLPGTHVTVVERSAAVLGVNHAQFALPRFHERLETVQGCAGEYLAHPRRRRGAGGWQVLQVDVYDAEARGPVLDTPAFYESCAGALRAPAICVVNLFGGHESLDPNLDRLRDAFDGRVFAFPPLPEGNVVALALKGPPLDVPAEALRARATEVATRYGLDEAPAWAEALLAGQDRLRL